MKHSSILAILAMCVLTQELSAATNPHSVTFAFAWKHPSGATATTYKILTKTTTLGEWKPQDVGWNSRNTSAGNKIHNIKTTGDGFNITANLPGGGTVTVTPTMCKAYWDAALPGWTFVSAATWAQNCYGYATGKGYWIQAPGFNVLMQDDYEVFSDEYCKANCISKEAGDHCKLLESCYAVDDLVKKVSQKYATSPVYEKTFAAPGAKYESDTIYCPR